MKRTFALMFIFLIVIFVILFVRVKALKNKILELQSFNSEYEIYSDGELNGLDVASAINKATSNNEKYGIDKDQEGFYNLADNYCVEVYISLVVDDQGNTKTYRMESFNKVGMNSFISSYAEANFECTSIKYYKDTGKVKSLTFKNID